MVAQLYPHISWKIVNRWHCLFTSWLRGNAPQEENKEDSEDEDSVEKVKELDEIAEFFKNVPKEKRQDFLYGMRTDGYDGAALEQQSFYKPAPPDYDNEYEHHVKEEAANYDYKADYAAYAKKQRDAANAKTSAELNSGSSTA